MFSRGRRGRPYLCGLLEKYTSPPLSSRLLILSSGTVGFQHRHFEGTHTFHQCVYTSPVSPPVMPAQSLYSAHLVVFSVLSPLFPSWNAPFLSAHPESHLSEISLRHTSSMKPSLMIPAYRALPILDPVFGIQFDTWFYPML